MFMLRPILLIVALTVFISNAQYMGSFPNNQFGPPRGDSRCGPDFNMAGCNPSECCSPAGFCGNTPMHCGGGNPNMMLGGNGGNNPSGFVRDDGRCGPDFGAVCAPGSCCSPAGFCGQGPQYCGGNGYGYGQGYPNGNPMMGGPMMGGPMIRPPNGQWNRPRNDGQCGPNYDWAGCWDGSCCGPDQYCGPQFCY